MVKHAWRITYNLDQSEYTPLQNGTATVEITNQLPHKLLITEVALYFDWLRDKYFSRGCNVELASKQNTKLPSLRFRIELNAPIGVTHYKLGVKYRELTKTGWIDKGLTWGWKGDHVMIKAAAERNFMVFISHSNHTEDASLLKECQQSLEKCGFKPYVAEASPEPGYPLWQKIHRNILSADALLVLWTKWATASGDIREEVGIAVGRSKLPRIIPLVETGTDVRGSLKWVEYISLDRSDTNAAISKAITQILNWARKKEEKHPRLKTEEQVVERANQQSKALKYKSNR